MTRPRQYARLLTLVLMGLAQVIVEGSAALFPLFNKKRARGFLCTMVAGAGTLLGMQPFRGQSYRLGPARPDASGTNLTFGLLRREGKAEGHRLLLHGIGTRVLGGLEDALAAHRINHRNRAAINNNIGITTASHVCRTRASTRGNIVELTVRQLYRTFSIRYADGCQKRRGGRQTNNVTTHPHSFR